MITKAFCLYDSKTGIFGTPFFFHHVGQAVRACMDLGADMSTTVGRHPADYSLVCIGSFDDQTGQLEHQAPEHIGTVVSMLPHQSSFQLAPGHRQVADQLDANGERA